jgi:hypothetical protein
MPPAPPVQPAGDSAAPAVKPPSKGRAILVRLGLAVVVLIVVVIGGAIWANVSGDPSVANVGDCVSGTVANANDTKVVKCTDASATGKVVGKVEGKTEAQFNTETEKICGPYPTAETAFWSGKSGSKGFVLCLEPVKK